MKETKKKSDENILNTFNEQQFAHNHQRTTVRSKQAKVTRDDECMNVKKNNFNEMEIGKNKRKKLQKKYKYKK